MDQNGEGIDVIIEIKLKTMDSQTHILQISNQRRVRNLKEDIALLIGMPVEQQRLIYCGKVLKDDQLISSYNVQHGDTLHLVCTVPGVSSNGSSSSRTGASHNTGTDGISPGTQLEISIAIENLSQQLNNMRQEYIVNGTENNMNEEEGRTENNMNEIVGNASNPSAPSQGIPTVEQFARLLSSTRDMLINETSRFFLELEGDLRQNINVDDPRLHHRTQPNAQRNRTLLDHLGAYFHELGRVMMQVQVGENGDEGSRLLPTAHRINNAHLMQLIQDFSSDASSQPLGETISVDERINPFQTLVSRHRREQPRTDISQGNNTELTDEDGRPTLNYTIRRLRYTSYRMIPVVPTADQGQAQVPHPDDEEFIQEVTEMFLNAGVQVGEDAAYDTVEGLSSGPTLAHESADEPANEDVGDTR